MTIHLHWWLVPAILLLISIWFFWAAWRGDVWDSIFINFIGIVCFLLAAAFTIGHFT